jgi:prolycopene isomerase
MDESSVVERMLDFAEGVLPGLRDHLTFVDEPASEPTGHIPLHRLGPIYGWAMSPRQAGVRRLPHQTPVAGLYLAGHWTQPGNGVFTVIESAVQAARLVLGIDRRAGVLPLRLPVLAQAV